MPERLSMDEVSKEKERRKFLTVISDVDKSSLLEVVNSHKSDEIIEELEKILLEISENVKKVSVDMWGGFPKVIQEVFPNASIVIDRFHVMKLGNQSLNKMRLPLEFKENRTILLKNKLDLTEEEMKKLQELLRESPCLRIAYELKEEFRDIYETSTTVKMGKRKMEKWLTHARLFFGETSQTIKNHIRSIC